MAQTLKHRKHVVVYGRLAHQWRWPPGRPAALHVGFWFRNLDIKGSECNADTADALMRAMCC